MTDLSNKQKWTLLVAEDKLQVWLSLLPGQTASPGIDLSLDMVLDQLGREGICFGVDTPAIEAAIAFFSENPDSQHGLPIASGLSAERVACPVEFLFLEQDVTWKEAQADGESISRTFSQVPLVRPQTVLAKPSSGKQQMGRDVFGTFFTSAEGAENNGSITVDCGENVVCCSESGEFRATASGYPSVGRSDGSKQERVLTISVAKVVHISPDAMTANLHLRPASLNVHLPDFETIQAILEEERVIFGHLKRRIHICLDAIVQRHIPMEVIAAMGVVPKDGIDATLHFEIEVGPLPGRIRGDGTIDFRDRKMFVGVNAGQLIAVKIPKTEGFAGTDVHGNSVPQKPGQDLVIKVTDDAVYDAETGEVRAARSGVLSMVTENSVKVCAKQVVSGDVDYTTGNIISRDSLEIGGSVLPQFKVVAFGDIVIGGNVEKANIRSDANVIVKGGIIGRKSRIEAKGDVDIPFIEHGRVFARGNIVLRKSAYYCRLHCWGNFFCPPGGKIIASQIVAAGALTMESVGGENADPALVAASVNPERLQLFYDYRRIQKTRQQEFDYLRHAVGEGSQNKAYRHAWQELQSINEAIRCLNMIPGTKLSDSPHENVYLPRTEICVSGKVSAGTVVRIGNVVRTLEQSFTGVRFQAVYQDAGDGVMRPVIAVQPLDKQ